MDDNLTKIMSSLDLDYSKAILSTLHFTQQIESLNKQLQGMKGIAVQTAKDVNAAFASQLGSGAGSKTLVDQYGNAFKTVQSEAKKMGSSTATSFTSGTTAAKAHGKAVQDVAKEYNVLGNEFNRRASWFLTGSMFYGTINAAKEAVSTINDVEMGMVEIARIMDDSTFSFEGYRDQLLQLGVDYGQTFENVQDIALRWAQAGYNVKDSLELTRTALLALNTAELDASNATESMIGIMAQWGLQADDLELVIDKINKTADDYSVSSQDLVDGLLRSSSAAKNMNMSIEDTISLLTVMREASGRTGQEVGNALNSILSYIQRPKSINTLEALGIDVFTDKAKTQFRNAMDIFKDVAANWNTTSDEIKDGFVQSADDAGLFNEELATALGLQAEWNDLQKRDIAQASAGVYRRNYYIGMIERLSNAQGVLNGMMDASGYSARENENTMDSLEKKYQSLKASIEQLAVALGDAGLLDVFKAIIDGTTTLTEAFNSLPEPMKDFTMSALTVIATVKLLKLGLTTLGIESIPNVNAAIVSLFKGTTTLTAGFKAAAAGVAGFVKANWPLLALAGTVGAITAIVNGLKKHHEETERAIESSRETIESLKSEVSNLESLGEEYDNISSKTETTVEERRRLVEIQKELASTYPELITGLDEEGNALATSTDKVKELTEAKRKQLEQELLAQKTLAQQTLPGLRKEFDEVENRINELSNKLQSGDTLEYYINGSYYSEGIDMSKKYSEELLKLAERRKELTSEIEKNEEAERLYAEVSEMAVEAYKQGADAAFDYASANENLVNSVKDISKELSSLNQDIYDVKNGQSLSADTILDLIEKYDLSADSIHKVSDGYTVEIETLEDLRQQKLKTTLENIENSKAEAKKTLEDQASKLEGYGLEIEQLKNLAEAKKAVTKIDEQAIKDFYSTLPDDIDIVGIDVLPKTKPQIALDEYENAVTELENLQKRADLLKSIATDSMYGVTVPKSGSTSKNATNEALSNALKLLEHTKSMSEETQASIQSEIEQLKTINTLYAKTESERMDMAERIYSAEKRLQDKRLQDSENWINEKKELGELSAEEEIAAWNRVLTNQAYNAEAVKLANTNLYKLRKQQAEDAAKAEEDSIKNLTTLGIYSVQEQIEAYKELYSVKAESMSEEQERIENLFNLYKQLLGEQQDKIKEAYDERIQMIEDEADAEKAKKEARIADLQEELDLLDKQDSQRTYEQTVSDIRKDIEYWQVRTSEEARKKVIELEQQLDEEKYKHELEQQKDSINDKIDGLEDEVDEIDRLADEEKKKWEKSYKLTEKAFDEHSTDMIALAGTMSDEMFRQFKNNYLDKIEEALTSGDYSSFDNLSNGIENAVDDLGNKTKNSTTAQIYNAAKEILSLKKQWTDLWNSGDTSAASKKAQQAEQHYNKLRSLGGKGQSVASQLNAADYETAKSIVLRLNKYHTGRLNGMEELAILRKDEIVFPPDLSRDLRALFPALRNVSNVNSNTANYDQKKEVKIGTLLNIENNNMGDDVDAEILTRELARTVTKIV